jgi:glucose/mannose-6-phosphate isomerase
MSMEQAIRDFSKQFAFEPVVEHAEKLVSKPAVIVSGMGGSHLAADLLKTAYPMRMVVVHSDYGLPGMPDPYFQNCLFIASSYSGNTEEVLDGLQEAQNKNMACAVVSVGGKLEALAKEHAMPYVKLPNTDIQPRSALGFSLLGIMKLMRMDEEIQELRGLADILKPEECEPQGNELAKKLNGFVPVIYASARNKSIAYNWKIKCNETGKIPAFYNVFPELNHNEMTGFDAIADTKHLSETFHFIFLRDTEDDSRIQKRMDVCKKLYEDRGLPVTNVPIVGVSRWDRIFNSLLIADWFAYYTGKGYGVETEEVPMVEEFKKLVNM